MKDGKLDGTYSAQQIEAFLRDAMTQGYGNPAEIVVVEQQQGQGPTGGVAGERISRPGSPEQAVRSTAPARTLPFTGIDLALVAGGGAFLLLMGLTARRVGRKTL